MRTPLLLGAALVALLTPLARPSSTSADLTFRPSRGVAMLGLLHPGVDPDPVLRALRAADRPALAFLWGAEGANFGGDVQNARSVVQGLLDAGQGPEVRIYMTNESSRGDAVRGPYVQFRPWMGVADYRRAWRLQDTAMLAEYEAQILGPVAAFVRELDGYSLARGQRVPRFVLVFGLEDQLGTGEAAGAAVRAWRGFVAARLGDVRKLAFARSPKTPGSITSASQADAYRVSSAVSLELHGHDPALVAALKPGDALSGDGDHHLFPAEPLWLPSALSGYMTLQGVESWSQIETLADRAQASGLTFLHWRAEYNGLHVKSPSPNPGEREPRMFAAGTLRHQALRALMGR